MKFFLKILITSFVLLFYINLCFAQARTPVNINDTLPVKTLDSIIVNAWLKAIGCILHARGGRYQNLCRKENKYINFSIKETAFLEFWTHCACKNTGA